MRESERKRERKLASKSKRKGENGEREGKVGRMLEERKVMRKREKREKDIRKA